MIQSNASKPLVAIACGGTGGHLFPGLAVGGELMQRGGDIVLMVSEKEIDQQAIKSAYGMEVAALPAIGLQSGRVRKFFGAFARSLLAAQHIFRRRRPCAVLGMGGFACAPPILAGKMFGAATFLHESNAIPGKANRWLAPFVDQIFVGFAEARARLHNRSVLVTGTPVRPQFQPTAADSARLALGLDAKRPVLLIMGGSQGASAVNRLVFQALPELRRAVPDLQFLHLTGPNDEANARAQYAAQDIRAVVHTFLTEMELALAAATIVVSRAGASSLAELAAMQIPAILIPYPSAADNHQFYNAHALASGGAAVRLDQAEATGEKLAILVVRLLEDSGHYAGIKTRVSQWHAPDAASRIAEHVLGRMAPRQCPETASASLSTAVLCRFGLVRARTVNPEL